MSATLSSAVPQLSRRDRAVLAAVAAGRGTVTAGRLLIDGLPCADQFVAARLRAAGVLETQVSGPARLTGDGVEALAA
ncbi:hypothetical protein LQ327_25325 [Actinomycetospora endophytica]|uniref:Winged helix DNA-binding protein n=1 Tax=Actinomycetospora endophytica TaxID=2291215 RepID=A0ABS8PEJ8_9PSEU|nr:hypothetical protein [Actinomycetospora endophytica]MCD2196697.1 hypothetical protein [Actinomycetospora endophytica]